MEPAGRHRSLMLVAAGVVVFTASCGDALVSGTRYDTPLFTFGIQYSPPLAQGVTPPRVGIVWVDPEDLEDDVPGRPETTRWEVTDDGLRLSFYAPPPARALHSVYDEQGRLATRFALGEIVLYDTLDASGAFAVTPRSRDPASDSPGSEIMDPAHYLGASSDEIVRYLETPLSEGTFPPRAELSPMLVGPMLGFAVARLGCPPASDPPSCYIVFPTGNIAMANVTMVIDDAPSKSLPFERSCLRTHYVKTIPHPPT